MIFSISHMKLLAREHPIVDLSTEKSVCNQKGFTIFELLVVIAILGVLAGVAIPVVAKFVGRGDTESRQAELQNIQTAVVAMLSESTTGELIPVATPTNDMDDVQTTDTTPLILRDYLFDLNPQGEVKSGYNYTFAADGAVTQIPP